MKKTNHEVSLSRMRISHKSAVVIFPILFRRSISDFTIYLSPRRIIIKASDFNNGSLIPLDSESFSLPLLYKNSLDLVTSKRQQPKGVHIAFALIRLVFFFIFFTCSHGEFSKRIGNMAACSLRHISRIFALLPTVRLLPILYPQ